MDITKIITESGMSILEIGDHVKKFQEFIPTLKEALPKIKTWEATQEKATGEVFIYSLLPTETEVYIYVNAIRERKTIVNGKEETETLLRVVKRFAGFEELDKIMSLIPKM